MTRIDEISDGIYRISTPVSPAVVAGGFSFNQYLIVDDAPLLFHTGLRSMFPAVRSAIERVMPAKDLRYIALSHFEADECGSLNDFLAIAPAAETLCSKVAAMTSLNDFCDRKPRGLADGDIIDLGKRKLRWFYTPHLPHNWECGLAMETTTQTLLCGDLFTQNGADNPPLTESDILTPTEEFRRRMGYFAVNDGVEAMLERLAETSPKTLACMHGSAWAGDGASLLRALAQSLKS